MSKKDFFRLLIKVFSVYCIIITLFSWIPSNLVYSIFEFNISTILITIGFLLIAILIFYLINLKSDSIIQLLKLDKGFDDNQIILGNFNQKQLLNLALIIIGGITLINYLSEFLLYSFLAFKNEVSQNNNSFIIEEGFGTFADYFNWVISIINIVLSYLIITNYSKISNWLLKKQS